MPIKVFTEFIKDCENLSYVINDIESQGLTFICSNKIEKNKDGEWFYLIFREN